MSKLPYRSNVPLDLWSHVRAWLFCGGVLLVLQGLAADPAWVEQTYIDHAGTVSMWVSWVTSVVPITFAEIVLLLLVVGVVLRTLEGVAEVGAGRRSLGNAAAGAAMHVLDLVLVLLMIFQGLWGMSYERPPPETRYALVLDRLDEGDAAALRALTKQLTDRTNKAYKALHGGADSGSVTVPREGLDVDAALTRGFARVGERYDLGTSFGVPRGGVKRPYVSLILSYLGIAGVYVPFTGEAVVNARPPAWSQVAHAAHEMAHQRMIAQEDEATFAGTLAMLAADEPLLTYVAWQTVRQQVQRQLVRLDATASDDLAGRLDPGPQRDVIAVFEFWERYRGQLQQMQGELNDAYLRMNDVDDGVASYGRAADLFRAWLRTPDGARALAGTKR